MTAAERMRETLRTDLKTAMRERRQADVALIRTLIAAIDNAEPAPLPDGAKPADSASFASGAAEADRLVLDEADIAAILTAEAASRREAAALIRQGGADNEAARLEREAGQVLAYCGVPMP